LKARALALEAILRRGWTIITQNQRSVKKKNKDPDLVDISEAALESRGQ
jgi:hypothetical protein